MECRRACSDLFLYCRDCRRARETSNVVQLNLLTRYREGVHALTVGQNTLRAIQEEILEEAGMLPPEAPTTREFVMELGVETHPMLGTSRAVEVNEATTTFAGDPRGVMERVPFRLR